MNRIDLNGESTQRVVPNIEQTVGNDGLAFMFKVYARIQYSTLNVGFLRSNGNGSAYQ